MPWLILLSPRTWFWAGIGVLFLALGVQTMRLDHEQAATARLELARANAAREAEARIASLQADHAAATQALSDAYAADLKSREAALATAHADGNSLREQIDRLAARPVGTAFDAASVRRLSDRTAAFGRVLGRYDRFAESLTGRAEQLGSEVRALKRQLQADRAACSVSP